MKVVVAWVSGADRDLIRRADVHLEPAVTQVRRGCGGDDAELKTDARTRVRRG